LQAQLLLAHPLNRPHRHVASPGPQPSVSFQS
jgi:hypothetical protein